MLQKLLARLFGSRNDRVVRQLQQQVAKINQLEPELQALDDATLKAKTQEFKQRLAAGASLDALLPEAFAVTREAARRTLGLRHYDVQLIGGMVLHQGRIAEMRTGEGKTLVATLAVYLNALAGKGVHVVTVNDYLARRDAAWMQPVYEALGLTVGVVVPGISPEDKRASYAADITYGTNNEFGFDYLRDNMALSANDRFQRGQFYAIVDEVDSILIDEARTPLIISGPAEDSPQLYVKVNRIVPQLIPQKEEEGTGDFWVDEKQKQVHLSEAGMEHAEQLLREAEIIQGDDSLYAAHNLIVVHHLNAALRANQLYQRDVDYIVRDGEVIIVDEFTGRTLAGRRWSDGLHQAVEAKENVPIQRENQTLASITFQNYFRLYQKLSGMTGTADTEAYEFQHIYSLEVVVIPTHRPMARKDHPDLVFLKRGGKFNAIVEDIKDCHERGQPVLVGTTSIETSEYIANLLQKEKVPHEVLNAKQHEREAHIVAQAGKPGVVTIATNMAGRGTDIVLGGNLSSELQALAEEVTESEREKLRQAWQIRHEQVLLAGGLHIIGTERHESRRIDNQLRGRSGRQGDPGSSRFYLSLEDNLMRIFAPEWVSKWMQIFGMKEEDALEDRLVTRQIEKAQRKVEAHNFDVRKHLLDFDDVANDQRKVIYAQRNELLEAQDISETIVDVRHGVILEICQRFVPQDSIDDMWQIQQLEKTLESDFGIKIEVQKHIDTQTEIATAHVYDFVIQSIDEYFAAKEQQFGIEQMRSVERFFMLQVLDTQWKEHLAGMDYLRQGIHLRGYAQKQPKQEFKRESFELFQQMLERVKTELITVLARVRIRSEEEVAELEREQQKRQQRQPMAFQHAEANELAREDAETAALSANTLVNTSRRNAAAQQFPKVGRNDPCPCGSGKKFKQCHGRLA